MIREPLRLRMFDAPRPTCLLPAYIVIGRRRLPLPQPRQHSLTWARQNLLPTVSPKESTTASRSPSLASTICTNVDHPSVDIPRKPLRNAARALPSRRPGSRFQNTNAPETAHSPGSAAFSNTNVSDASSRMVRISFTNAAPCSPDQTRQVERAAIQTLGGQPQSCPYGEPANRRSHQYRAAHPALAVTAPDNF